MYREWVSRCTADRGEDVAGVRVICAHRRAWARRDRIDTTAVERKGCAAILRVCRIS
jgi:hypothetical protein